MLEDIEIIQYMQRTNPWWSTGKIPANLVENFHRRDFYKICERLPDRFIMSLTGLRRVGKTTLINQLINHLLQEEDVSARNILFLTFDDPFWNLASVSIQKILDLYCETILGSVLTDLPTDTRVYFFIDEIQYQPDWERIIKVLYDRKLPFKFIISGSSSIHLYSKSSESLVGRVHIQKIFPFKFLEACRFIYQATDQEQELKDLNGFNWRLRKSIETSVRNDSPADIIEFLEKEKLYWLSNKQQWHIRINDYIVRGGFPETLNHDLIESRKYIQTFIDLTIHRDIQNLFSIRQVDKFKKLFLWIVRESSQRTNVKNLTNTIGIKYETLQQYLEALETTYLIRQLPYYAKSTSKQIRWPVKLFIGDIGIQAAYLNFPLYIHEYNTQILGKVIETLVCDHVTRLKFNLEQGLIQPLYYWMDPNTREEVDIICELFHKPIPIEVKYQTQIRKNDLVGIKKFLDTYDSPFGFVVSKETLDTNTDNKILILPLWLFLLAP
ncbi:MAG: ATP-binding protein [Candidatus Hodarchaeota archaeon]